MATSTGWRASSPRAAPPETTLALLTHDRDLSVDALPLRARQDVRAGNGPPWSLSLYRRSG